MGQALPSPHIGGPCRRVPNTGGGQVAALRAAPRPGGVTSGRQEGGRGLRFGGCSTPSQANPVPSLGRVAKFWD
jgi:hypothetical protein